MKHYGEFIKEREGLDLLEFPEGFLTFKVEADECFVANLFIHPDFRGTPALFRFYEKLEKLSLEKNAKYISANIHLNDHGFNRTLKAVLKLGFSLVQAQNGSVIIVKKIGGSNG